MGETLFDALPNAETAQEIHNARYLSDIDHINRLRLMDGSHAAETLYGIHENLTPGIKEGALPHAVSKTHQARRDGKNYWLDQDDEAVPASGYLFHQHPGALRRVSVEIDEAIDVRDNLKEGEVKILLSPKMSRKDASLEDAEREHLAHEDMIRIHYLNIDERGEIQGKFMESILVKDIPLSAWVAMLKDPQNIFGKSIVVEDDGSAISVMQVHQELIVPKEKLPEGAVNIVEAVLPYLEDQDREKVASQIALFRSNQQELHQLAEEKAWQWLDFEIALADSLHEGYAKKDVIAFISTLSHQWIPEFNALLTQHYNPNGYLHMTRNLAIEIEKAYRATLFGITSVKGGNEEVREAMQQKDETLYQKISDNEIIIDMMRQNGESPENIAMVAAENMRYAAQLNVSVGGGCSGSVSAAFIESQNSSVNGSNHINEAGETIKFDNRGICVVETCSKRPQITDIGPCGVCRDCQLVFDLNGDPTKPGMVRAVASAIQRTRKPASVATT